jgi:hypothetical protein
MRRPPLAKLQVVLWSSIARAFGDGARVAHKGDEDFAWLLGYQQMRRMLEPDHVLLRRLYLREPVAETEAFTFWSQSADRDASGNRSHFATGLELLSRPGFCSLRRLVVAP